MIPYPNEPFRRIRNDEHLENLFDYAFELYRYKTRGSSKGDVFIALLRSITISRLRYLLKKEREYTAAENKLIIFGYIDILNEVTRVLLEKIGNSNPFDFFDTLDEELVIELKDMPLFVTGLCFKLSNKVIGFSSKNDVGFGEFWINDVKRLICASYSNIYIKIMRDRGYLMNNIIPATTRGKKQRRLINRHNTFSLPYNSLNEYINHGDVIQQLTSHGVNNSKTMFIKILRKLHKTKKIDLFNRSYGWDRIPEYIDEHVMRNKENYRELNKQLFEMSGIADVLIPDNKILYVNICDVGTNKTLTAILKVHKHISKYVDLYRLNVNRDGMYIPTPLLNFEIIGFKLSKSDN